MPEISILLPSLRPEAVLQRIKEFSVTNKDSDYEIIVVSPFPIKGDRVVYIYEEKQLGTIHAHNVAYNKSSGEYVVPWSDDTVPSTNCLSNILRFVKGKKEPFIGSFRLRRQGREKSQWVVYGKLYAGQACFSKSTVNLIGGYYDPIYRGYWADPDMCLRTWEKGGRVEVCPDAWIEDNNIMDEVRGKNFDRYSARDTETFFNRWHDKLGKGTEKKDWTSINKPIYIPALYFDIVKVFPSFVNSALFIVYCRILSITEKPRRWLLSRLFLIAH